MKIYSALFLILTSIASCGPKTSVVGNSASTATATATATATTTSTLATTTTTTTGISCDGIATATATQCYYKNMPLIQVSGQAPGTIYWDSRALGAAISQNQFVTDAVFNVRIIPRIANPNNLATSSKVCSQFTLNDSKNIQVQMMLLKPGTSVGEVATLSSSLNTPSNVWHFTPPKGATGPLSIQVTSVLSDTRCNWSGGVSYCPFADIPINTLGPTECVAFELQFSTDTTYDLPGASAN